MLKFHIPITILVSPNPSNRIFRSLSMFDLTYKKIFSLISVSKTQIQRSVYKISDRMDDPSSQDQDSRDSSVVEVNRMPSSDLNIFVKLIFLPQFERWITRRVYFTKLPHYMQSNWCLIYALSLVINAIQLIVLYYVQAVKFFRCVLRRIDSDWFDETFVQLCRWCWWIPNGQSVVRVLSNWRKSRSVPKYFHNFWNICTLARFEYHCRRWCQCWP